jgi:hypothetical protein
MNLPGPLKSLMRLPYMERMFAEMVQCFIATPLEAGSVDLVPPGASACW